MGLELYRALKSANVDEELAAKASNEATEARETAHGIELKLEQLRTEMVSKLAAIDTKLTVQTAILAMIAFILVGRFIQAAF